MRTSRRLPRRRSLSCLLIVCALAAACSRRTDRATIDNRGSDTLLSVAQAWAEAYKKVDPSVGVAIAGGGSGTGIAALINGTVQIANSSRRFKPQELELAKRRGVAPRENIVGHDAVVVFVHADNPLPSITVEQLAEIYGDGGTIERWSQLGVELPGGDDRIVRVSRQNNSGTYEYFKEAVLGGQRDYKLGSLDLHGSKDVADLVEKTPGAIGYSGLAYATSRLRMLPVAKAGGGAPVAPSVDTALDGSYPIARPLFMYTAGEPQGKVKEYLDWILSDAGQRILVALEYAPVRRLD
jgi:phosphate transport system substrate-binding protein